MTALARRRERPMCPSNTPIINFKEKVVCMQKKIPQRQCMGCRERKGKKELIRVVRTTDGTVCLDFSGKLNGRGAYLCPELTCLQKARKAKSLERALEVEIPREVYDRLEEEMERSHG